MKQDFDTARSEMVARQLKARDITSPAVLNAMGEVPRHLFVPEDLWSHAYNDGPLPIGLGQTISQPYIVAYMTEHLRPFPGMKVLEIGTGSGYQTAVLAQLGCEVFSIESLSELAATAEEALASLGYGGVHLRHANGYDGWPEEAPFDAIIVTAAPEVIPQALLEQLKDGGKMIIPVGPIHSTQSLQLITKEAGKFATKDLLPVRFVPML
ncbi:MAG: protein-L-isoaspartate(D-aspartate) O-methyltransferase [Coriobacteriia bacterium]|nr:protein-L-isoaspartate(D-aspartate) O-methyltransferase [Coriobacteriia bacterium]MCL2750434.1 protein-L-isoaspartate(D-aspartate) O-methyltransferase [Coriobacteriia bacterium]